MDIVDAVSLRAPGERKRVDVAGGGYAGMTLAVTVAHRKKPADGIEIVFVESRPYQQALSELDLVAAGTPRPQFAELWHADVFRGLPVKVVYDRLENVRRPGQSDDLLVFLAFSGGGTRAASFSYGVLEELARTEVTVGGSRRRLLDEVDVISAVSGGTFTATYYALRGDRIFQEFEGKFLKRNIEHALAGRVLSPGNWFRLPSGTFNRSDVAAELYDETVFDHATFGDLLKSGGPYVVVNGADVTTGARFTYTQDTFDVLCSDLSAFPIARAVANAPRILLADEPTGNLDIHTAEHVFQALSQLVRASGLATIIATHNMDLAARMDRRVSLREGRIVEMD